eukprot:CAMPEP_0184478216 /NCGR_PEP_ID=MMETSP0113_2-20130426/299_1 /TAXON_ID=91329 /ORGANISM="Norrisiella sphaerica, Strain BC52" /LENGTH=310 /DNA_ID=CAMNT_0026855921 /DNA_START=144 /DNA_END=1076 /DNA_ORIENTATION=+
MVSGPLTSDSESLLVRGFNGTKELNLTTTKGRPSDDVFVELLGNNTTEQLKPCMLDGQPIFRFVFPSVPRSGNTMMRELLERSTGISTSSVFPEMTNKLSNRSLFYEPPCGIIKDCDKVRQVRKGEPSLIKTHYPFHNPEFEIDTCLSGIVTTIREPVDEFLATRYFYCFKRNSTFVSGKPSPETRKCRNLKGKGVEHFAQQWSMHHSYWDAVSRNLGIPLLRVRFEDLLEKPAAVIKKVTEFTGAKQIRPVDTDASVGRTKLRNLYKVESFLMLTLEEVESVRELYETKLTRYGYDTASLDPRRIFLKH